MKDRQTACQVPISIRRFQLSGLPAVMAIERASFRRDAYPRDLFLDYYEHGALFLVAVAGDEVIGYILCARKGVRAEVISIAVAPGCRRSGAGRTLLTTAMRRLRSVGAERISLMVKVTNLAAQRFYESFGFRRVRRVARYYEDGRDGLLLTRDLVG